MKYLDAERAGRTSPPLRRQLALLAQLDGAALLHPWRAWDPATSSQTGGMGATRRRRPRRLRRDAGAPAESLSLADDQQERRRRRDRPTAPVTPTSTPSRDTIDFYAAPREGIQRPADALGLRFAAEVDAEREVRRVDALAVVGQRFVAAGAPASR